MTERDRRRWEYLLRNRYFPELAYFAAASAYAAPSAEAHLFAGIGCCGHVSLEAAAQRIMEDAPIDEGLIGTGGLRVNPGSNMTYAGLDHLLTAFRADPRLSVPDDLRETIDTVADDLAYMSRREIQSSRRYSYTQTCIIAAVLLRRLTGTKRELPAMEARINGAERVLADELSV